MKIAQSEDIQWTPLILSEGTKGLIIADVKPLRFYIARGDLPEETPSWLFIHRTSDGQVKYAISNAPGNIPFSELCEASTMQWPIRQCSEEGKSNLKMGDYEHCSWQAWH
ncbi:MAG: hypothetical protein SWO11_21770 [Thermodesulfobacteriota bacterium]|nr:hypothetical protein [Thermodesulfobacteriota bacterium]